MRRGGENQEGGTAGEGKGRGEKAGKMAQLVRVKALATKLSEANPIPATIMVERIAPTSCL